MSFATVARSLLIAFAIAASAPADADAPSRSLSKPSSLAPHPQARHSAYGAPIQAPIVGRKASHSKKPPAKSASAGKPRNASSQRSELDQPF